MISESTNLIFPVLFYKGYAVEGEGEGDISDIHHAGQIKGRDMHGFIEITVNGSGSLTLQYVGTWIQKISLGVSLLTFSLFLWWLNKKNHYLEIVKKKLN